MKFFNDGEPDLSLYQDEVHLNPKGGKILGKNIRQALNSVLCLQENDRNGS